MSAAQDASPHTRQPRGPHGPLERGSLEDRHVRLARASSSSPSRIGGAVGTKTLDPNTHGPGRVRPHGQDPRRRLQAARRRERPDPEQVAPRRAIPPSGRRSRTSSRGISTLERRPARALAARSRQRRPDREGRARGARRVRDPRRHGQGGRQDRPVLDRVDEVQQAHPRLFIGEFGDASAVDGARDGLRRATSRRPGCSRSRSR